jgi:hypothetical protein
MELTEQLEQLVRKALQVLTELKAHKVLLEQTELMEQTVFPLTGQEALQRHQAHQH